MYFSDRKRADDRELQSFCRELGKVLASLGLRARSGMPAFLMANPNGDIKQALGELITKTNNHFRCQKPSLIVTLAHSSLHAGVYKTLKQHSEVDFGVPCQYLQLEKCLKQNGQIQYLANVGLKIKVKLGGSNSVVKDPFFSKPFMMLGADCTHPRPSELRRDATPPSVAALVGSYDQQASCFTSVATAQDPTMELIRDLGPMADELLKRF